MKVVTIAAGLALACVPATATFVSAQSEMAAPVVDAQQFADTAASSNMFEIESSRLALERSQNDEITAFAELMIADHTAAGEEMAAAAEEDGVTPVAEMMEKHQTVLDDLAAAEDVQFDEAYIDAQAAAHDEAVALFEGYSTDGEEGALKAFAGETLPILVQHHAHITGLATN